MHRRQDRNLVFGLLAVQHKFIAAHQLLEAANRWLAEENSSLPTAMLQCGFLTQPQAETIEQAVQDYIDNPGSIELQLKSSDDAAMFSVLDANQANDYKVNALFSSWHSVDDESSDPKPLPTDRSSSYQFLKSLASGGLGRVSIANDSALQREVAIKEVLPKYSHSNKAIHRFLNEAKVTGGLEHPGVVPVYAMGNKDGHPFYVMRLIRGESLREAIRKLHGGKKQVKSFEQLDRQEFRRLLKSLGDACHTIAYAHSQGVLHRDLKPGNLMLGSYGETIVVDWGMAKASRSPSDATASESTTSESPDRDDASPLPPDLTKESLLGTPAFMCPEQANKRTTEIDERSDIFCLGACLYSMLANRAPFMAATAQESLKLAKQCQVPNLRKSDPTIPRAIQAIYQKAMHPDPLRRYATATELVEDINRWTAGEPTVACPESTPEKLNRWAREHQNFIAISMAFLLLSVVGLLVSNRLISSERDLKIAALHDAQGARDAAELALKKAKEQEQLAINARKDADQRWKRLHNVVDDFFVELANYKLAEMGNNESERAELVTYALDVMRPLAQQSPNDLKIKASLIQFLGVASGIYRNNRQADLAIAASDELLGQLKSLEKLGQDDPKLVVTICDAKATVAAMKRRQLGEPEAERFSKQSLNFCENHMTELKGDAFEIGFVRAAILRVDILLQKRNIDAADKLIARAKAQVPHIKYPAVPYLPDYWQYYLDLQQLTVFQLRGELKFASEHADRTLEKLSKASEKHNNPIGLMAPLYSLQTKKAMIEQSRGNYKVANQILEDAEKNFLNASEEYPNHFPLADSYCDFLVGSAWVAFEQKDWNKAEGYSRKALNQLKRVQGDCDVQFVDHQRMELLALAILSRTVKREKAEFENQTRLDELRKSLANKNSNAISYRAAIDVLKPLLKGQ